MEEKETCLAFNIVEENLRTRKHIHIQHTIAAPKSVNINPIIIVSVGVDGWKKKASVMLFQASNQMICCDYDEVLILRLKKKYCFRTTRIQTALSAFITFSQFLLGSGIGWDARDMTSYPFKYSKFKKT